MMKQLLGLVAGFGLMVMPAAAVRADEVAQPKIGIVDMQKALQSVDAGRKAKTQLEKEFNSKKKELQTEEAQIKKLGEEFKKQSLVLSDDARAKKQAELQERFMKFQEMTQRAQQEIQVKEQELTAPLVSSLRTIIADLAKKRGMTVVLEKNENTVLFSLEKDEITEEVVSTFNKQNKS